MILKMFKLWRWTSKWLLFFDFFFKKSERFCTLGTTIRVYNTNCLTKTGNEVLPKEVIVRRVLGLYFKVTLNSMFILIVKILKISKLLRGLHIWTNQRSQYILYKSLVRSQVDHGNSIWFPVLKKDIRVFENTQRRPTRLVPDLRRRLIWEEDWMRLAIMLYPR